MQIRAAVLSAIGLPRPYALSRPLEIARINLDPPGAGEVLVAIRAAGLCHSDLSVIDGNRARPVPMVLGHEAAGVIEELGSGVEDLSIGDHVVMAFVPSCGVCEACAAGRAALCEPGAAANGAGALLGGGRRLRRGREPVNHHLGVSAFAEYAVVSRHSVVKIDRSLPFPEAALFGCAVLTGVGAVVNTVAVQDTSRVAVIGLGGVGLAALLAARLRSARVLIAVDLSDSKLQLARELGATFTVNAGQPGAIEAIREATGGGVDYAFEMAGSQKAMHLAYGITRRGGTTITAGLPHPSVEFSVKHVSIVSEERTVKGSYLGSSNPQRDIPRYIEWFRAGKLPVERLLSKTIQLEDINAAFDSLADAVSVRQVVIL